MKPADTLLEPTRLWRRSEVLANPSPVQPAAGVYAWYISDLLGREETDGCVTFDGVPLLYVGISPRRPPTNGKPPSTQNLRKRLRYHYRGNAAGSTLRLTLGCLLSDRLGIELRRVGSGGRMTFHDGEAVLSEWMADHARVTWIETPAPWLEEERLIGSLHLPLNLDQNGRCTFWPRLTHARKQAKARAAALPVLG